MVQGWKEDEELEKKFVSNDLELINKLEQLFTKTNTRKNHVENVKDNLSTGIRIMNDFLGNMGSKKEEANKSHEQNGDSLPKQETRD